MALAVGIIFIVLGVYTLLFPRPMVKLLMRQWEKHPWPSASKDELQRIRRKISDGHALDAKELKLARQFFPYNFKGELNKYRIGAAFFTVMGIIQVVAGE